jgi:hypothetical protein
MNARSLPATVPPVFYRKEKIVTRSVFSGIIHTIMVKRFMLLVWATLFALPFVFAQNAPVTKLGDVVVVPAPPTSISVPLIVTGFNNVAGASLMFNYNPAVLTYTGFVPNGILPGVTMVGNPLPGVITVTYADFFLSGTPLPDGSIFLTVNFTYLGGLSNLTWDLSSPTNNEWTDILMAPMNDISEPNYYKNGIVTDVATGSAITPTTYAAEMFAPAGPILYPITVDNLSNCDAISLTLDYDPAHLTYTGITNLLPALAGSMTSASGGKFYFTWTGTGTPITTVLPSGTKLFDIQFNALSGTSYLTWDNIPTTDCEYQDFLAQVPYPDMPTSTFYKNGFVSNLACTYNYTHVICKGANDGTITFNPTGGSTNYEFSINNGVNWYPTAAFTGLAPNTYNLWVRDASYPLVKINMGSVTIMEPALALYVNTFESHRVRCKGEQNGQATINAFGGWGNYTYSIDGITWHTLNIFDALFPGTYTLYAKDNLGCIASGTIMITEPTIALTASGIETKKVTCYGGSNGQITLTGYDGWGTYNYSKDDITYQVSNVLTGFPAGNHTVYVKDKGGCTVPVVVTVTQPAAPLAVTAVPSKMVTCFGYSDGEITATAVGGWGSYEYSINGGLTWQISNVFPGLAAGPYTIHVRDFEGCITLTVSATVVTEPSQLAGVLSGTTTVCYNTNATIQVDIAGGTPPYTFTITDGVTPVTVSNFFGNVYTITQPYTQPTTWTWVSLTDVNGCSSNLSGNAIISIYPLPQVGFSFNGTLAGTGSIFDYCYNVPVAVTLSNIWVGTAPFNISWTVNGTPYSATGVNLNDALFNSTLAAGTYIVQITSIVDANGCSPASYAPYTATVNIHPEPAVGFSFNGNLAGTGSIFNYCFNETVTATLSNNWVGTAPYTIAWTVNGVPASASNVNLNDILFSSTLTAGTYVVQITSIVDANGCSPSSYAPYTATVIVNPEPAVGFSFNGQLAGTGSIFNYCYNETVTVNLSDIWVGTAPFDIAWTVNGVPASATGVNLSDVLFSNIMAPGSYVVQITSIVDAKGCSPASYVPYTATVNVHPEPAVGFSFNGNLAGTGSVFNYCYNETVTVTLSHNWVGTAPYSLAWTVDDGSGPVTSTATGVNVSDILFSNILAPGTYVVQITSIVDANGCSPASYSPYTATVNVFEEPKFSFGFNGVEAGPNAAFQYCYDQPVGVTLFAQYGGTAPYSVTYTVNGGTPITVNNLNVGSVISASQLYAPGIYVIQVTDITDANGCKASASFLAICNATVTIHDEPIISFGFNGVEAGHNATFTYCYDQPVGVTLYAQYGGTAPYSVTYTVNGGTPVTVGGLSVGSTIIAPQLYAAGTYNIVVTNITDVYGCVASPAFLALCQATVVINPEPAVGFSFNGVLAGTGSIFDYCYDEIVTVKLSDIWVGTPPFDISWTVNGIPASASGVNLNGTLFSNILAPGTYVVQITSIVDFKGCSPSSYLPYTATVNIHSQVVEGYYKYHNLSEKALNNISVDLKQGATVKYSTVTDANGYYKFPAVCPGTYEVVSTTIKPVTGAINSTDAIQADIWGVTPYSIEKVRFLAGDVTFNFSFIDNGDAIAILQNFVNSGNVPFNFNPNWVFWQKGDFTSVNPTILSPLPVLNIGFTDMVQDFYGLVAGDFNRSFTPGNAKGGSSVILQKDAKVLAPQQNVIQLPVTARMNMKVTAISLILNYPADKVEIMDVTLGNNMNPVIWKAVNGELRIAWSSINPAWFQNGDVFLTLKVKTTSSLNNGEMISFTLANDNLNEIADMNADPIQGAVLSVGAIEGTVGIPGASGSSLLALNVYPNPFSTNAQIQYTVPSAGKVTVELFDITGKLITTLADMNQSAGTYSISLDGMELPAGVYNAKMSLETENGLISGSIRIIRNK